jgi:hypothetical protein
VPHPPRPAALRVLNRLTLEDHGFGTPCWCWTGATISERKPYGKVGSRIAGQSKFELTHRVIYEAWYGPIEPGFELDHRCRVRLCANPLHTEAVPPAVNRRRQTEYWRSVRQQTEAQAA